MFVSLMLLIAALSMMSGARRLDHKAASRGGAFPITAPMMHLSNSPVVSLQRLHVQPSWSNQSKGSFPSLGWTANDPAFGNAEGISKYKPNAQRSSMPRASARANVSMKVGHHMRTMDDSHSRGDAAFVAPSDVSGRWDLRRIKPAVQRAAVIMAAVLSILYSPMQASAMGGGTISGGGGSSRSSPSPSPPPSPPPSYSSPPSSYSYSIRASPPSSTVYVFPPSPPPRPLTRAEIEANEKARAEFNAAVGHLAEAAKWPLIAVGTAYAGYAAVEFQTRAWKPTGGRSQETILSDRRSQVNRWPGRFLMDKELELRPPDGKWTGEYMEDGVMGKITYDLKFDYNKETFQGRGEDPDGGFIVENGVYSAATGRFIWTQRSQIGSGYLVVECVASVCNVKSDGLYGRPGSLDGNYATTAGYRGKFTIGPLP